MSITTRRLRTELRLASQKKIQAANAVHAARKAGRTDEAAAKLLKAAKRTIAALEAKLSYR